MTTTTAALADALRDFIDCADSHEALAAAARAALAAYEAERQQDRTAEMLANVRGLIDYVGTLPKPRGTPDRHTRIMATGLAHNALAYLSKQPTSSQAVPLGPHAGLQA